jgi:RNA polymerase sigma factor (TIGR02999 family)
MPPLASDATATLQAHVRGEPAAAEQLLPLVYDTLRLLARRYLRREGPGQSLQPTELVHEAYLRLIDQDRIDWKGRTHFFAMAAIQMRRILVERARAKAAVKRGAGMRRIALHDGLANDPGTSLDLLALDEALDRLEQRNARQCRVAELRIFSGLEHMEVAEAVGVGEKTVREDWKKARAWLARELRRSPA